MLAELTVVDSEKKIVQIEFTNDLQYDIQYLDLNHVNAQELEDFFQFEPPIVHKDRVAVTEATDEIIILKPGEEYVTSPISLNEHYSLSSVIPLQLRYHSLHRTNQSDESEKILVESNWIAL